MSFVYYVTMSFVYYVTMSFVYYVTMSFVYYDCVKSVSKLLRTLPRCLIFSIFAITSFFDKKVNNPKNGLHGN